MDLWFRKDSRITMSDIIDRMNPKFIKSSDLPKLPTLDDPATDEEYERYGDPYTDANKIARLQAKKEVRKNTVDTLLTRRLSNRVTRFRQQHNLLAPETRRIDQTSSGEDMKKVNNLSEEKRLANVAWEIEGDKMFHPQPKLKRSTVSNYQRTRYPLSARLNPTGYSSRVAAIIAELRKKDALASLKDRRNPRNQDKRKQTIAERREKRRHTQVEVDETDRQSRATESQALEELSPVPLAAPQAAPRNLKRKLSLDTGSSRKRGRPTLASSDVEDTFVEEVPSAVGGAKVDPVEHWTRNLFEWPKEYFEPESNKASNQARNKANNMDHLLARKKSPSTLSSKKTDTTSDASSVTTSKTDRSARYRSRDYEVELEKKSNSFMDESDRGITDASESICRKLLEEPQTVPQDSLFDDDIFVQTRKMIRDRNEAKV
ncbi:hypothetical protein LTR04_002516, partial [Oleoguttula sp. CCFEE 6159]